MFTLYARKGAGSAAVEAMLALVGAPYEVTDLEREADGSLPQFFHRINPRAEVPTLLMPDDSVMTESAAILIHLADSNPAAGLAPAVTDPLRARYLRWMLFLATTIYMSDLRMYFPERYTSDADGAAAIKATAEAGMAREIAIYADALGEGPFILGKTMSAADIYAAMLMNWAPDLKGVFAQHPNIKTMYERVTAIPAVAAVWQRNGM